VQYSDSEAKEAVDTFIAKAVSHQGAPVKV